MVGVPLSKALSGARHRPGEEWSWQREQRKSQYRGPEVGVSLRICKESRRPAWLVWVSREEGECVLGGGGEFKSSVGATGHGVFGVYSKWEGGLLGEFSREMCPDSGTSHPSTAGWRADWRE